MHVYFIQIPKAYDFSKVLCLEPYKKYNFSIHNPKKQIHKQKQPTTHVFDLFTNFVV